MHQASIGLAIGVPQDKRGPLDAHRTWLTEESAFERVQIFV
jgi:hypothetical protein